jgi:hypothetical protein
VVLNPSYQLLERRSAPVHREAWTSHPVPLLVLRHLLVSFVELFYITLVDLDLSTS